MALLMLGGPGVVAAGSQVTPAPPTSGGPVASSPTGSDAESWYRVFLTDGQVVTALGEFTRVDDTVVLQVPLGPIGSGALPETRAVTIPADDVDWPRTEAYRDAIRRARFEQAGGARAYAAFTEEVAATVRDVALLPDPLERIHRLETARAQLAQWPAAHHGYRSDEVAQALSVIDDLLNGMRAAAGQQTFSLALTAAPAAPSTGVSTPLLPPPTLQDVIAQALGLAPRVADAGERLLLLESAAALLAKADAVDPKWAREARGRVRREIGQERRVSRAYDKLRTWMLGRMNRLLAAADVRGLMTLRTEVERRDARLDRKRPAEVASLLATLDARLDQARRQRLLLERWLERRPVLEAYAGAVGRHLATGLPLARALEEIKALAGPDPVVLTQAEGQLAGTRAESGMLVVPEEARAIQQVWIAAQQLAGRALEGRRTAVRTGNMQQAWDASAAAAGALLLFQQLRTDLSALVRRPALPTAGA